MKAELKFLYDTNDPESRSDIKTIQQAGDLKHILFELDQNLRSRIKHESSLSEEARKVLEETREFINDECRDRGINLFD